jgi:hypothetical protein
MEGGCETGEIAAFQIMQDLGLTASAQAQKTRIQQNFKARGLINRRLAAP